VLVVSISNWSPVRSEIVFGGVVHNNVELFLGIECEY
jgi:hypothetical protein